MRTGGGGGRIHGGGGFAYSCVQGGWEVKKQPKVHTYLMDDTISALRNLQKPFRERFDEAEI